MERAQFMALFGRPVHFSFIMQGETGENEEYVVEELLNFLKKKLLKEPQGGTAEPGYGWKTRKSMDMDEELVADFGEDQILPEKGNPKFYTQTQVVAVLGSIASIEVNAGSRMASELVSGHLRLAAAVTKLRKFIYTFEVSEPMLALTAHNLIISGKMPWNVVIDKFNATTLNNSTATGYRGELGFQLLGLMAWQKFLLTEKVENEPLTRFPALSAVLYLENLFGIELVELEARAEAISKEICAPGGRKTPVLSEGVLDNLRERVRDLEVQGTGSRQKWKDPQVVAMMGKEPGARVKVACVTLNSARAWSKLKNKFKRGRVRVFQFVKVIGEVTKAMLVEFFIRGSAIVCRNNEGVVDIIIPVFFPLFEGDIISADRMGSIVVQVKLRANFCSESEKVQWLDHTDDLAFLVNSDVPSVGIFCEFGSQSAESFAPNASDLPKTRRDDSARFGTPKLVVFDRRMDTVSSGGCHYGLFIRRLSVSDIFPLDRQAQEAFQRLLESTIDPSESKNVDILFRKDIREMFKTQPYMETGENWLKPETVTETPKPRPKKPKH
jgi:hypothetical protein